MAVTSAGQDPGGDSGLLETVTLTLSLQHESSPFDDHIVAQTGPPNRKMIQVALKPEYPPRPGILALESQKACSIG